MLQIRYKSPKSSSYSSFFIGTMEITTVFFHCQIFYSLPAHTELYLRTEKCCCYQQCLKNKERKMLQDGQKGIAKRNMKGSCFLYLRVDTQRLRTHRHFSQSLFNHMKNSLRSIAYFSFISYQKCMHASSQDGLFRYQEDIKRQFLTLLNRYRGF